MTRQIAMMFAMLFGALALASCSNSAPRGPLILAAVSLQEVLDDAADRWETKGNVRPVLSFAGTPALARQIEAGAEADMFISADKLWVDYLASEGAVSPDRTTTIASNRLVIIEPIARPDSAAPPPFAIADPDAVPAGRYGKAALQYLGEWDGTQSRLIPTENVRAALILVERGEAEGLVYATDAQASSKVKVTREIPATSHPVIAYVAVMLSGPQQSEAERFLSYLQSEEGLALFDQHGFTRSQ